MPAEAFVSNTLSAPYSRSVAGDALSYFRAAAERLASEHADDSGRVRVPYRIECWTARKRED
jgi:hypothetical protein